MSGPESSLRSEGRLHAILLIAIVAVGVILRTIEYASLGSLWVDELFIALNVTTRPLGELLTTPLDHHQVAPVGFLAAEKIATLLFGVNEAALRLFPYLASLGALPLFWVVGKRFLSRAALLAGMAMIAASPALLWFARNAKQYSSDVAVTLLLILLALRMQEERQARRTFVTAAVLGGVAILFSHPAVIVALVLLAVLAIQRARSGQGVRPLVIVAVAWLLAAAVVSVTSLMLAPLETREFMRAGWTRRGFMPLSPRALVWVPLRLLQILGVVLGQLAADRLGEMVLVGIFGTLAAIGWPYLARKAPVRTALLSGILAGAVLFSAARIFPMSGRVSLYLAPIVLILVLAGTDRLRTWLPRGAQPLGRAGLCLLAVLPATVLILFGEFPHQREESRIVLQRVRERWEPGDVLYVLPAAERAMEFYGRPMGFTEWYAGTAPRDEVRNHLEALDSLRGNRRVWFFYSHAVTCHQQLIRSYLETIGVEVARIEDPKGNRSKREAAAYLYDLSDPNRLARSNARVFPVPARIADGCGDPPEKGPLPRVIERLERIGDVFRG